VPRRNRSRGRAYAFPPATTFYPASLPTGQDGKPCSGAGLIGLDTWRTREWYPALEAAGLGRRGPYALRHTFGTEALAAGVSTFELARSWAPASR
jgi:integrase